ncbi:MAG: deoxynucleoside kinase [Candidatus Micrarchaeota archaeon]|nr:deoxynucleoside kinase [Candidatus Micrarchaeota archaeon]
MMIVIEGIDGSGKSTASKALANKLNLTYLHPAGNTDLFKKFKNDIDNSKQAVIPGFIYYSMLNQIAIRSVRDKINSKRETVIFDRFLYSVIAVQTTLDKLYNNSKNETKLNKFKKIIFEEFPKPNATVFLYVEMKERMKRLLRKNNKENLLFDKNTNFAISLQSEFKNLALELKKSKLNILEIETTNLGSREVLQKIMDFLSGY